MSYLLALVVLVLTSIPCLSQDFENRVITDRVSSRLSILGELSMPHPTQVQVHLIDLTDDWSFFGTMNIIGKEEAYFLVGPAFNLNMNQRTAMRIIAWAGYASSARQLGLGLAGKLVGRREGGEATYNIEVDYKQTSRSSWYLANIDVKILPLAGGYVGGGFKADKAIITGPFISFGTDTWEKYLNFWLAYGKDQAGANKLAIGFTSGWDIE